jgi:hypothetical protein
MKMAKKSGRKKSKVRRMKMHEKRHEIHGGKDGFSHGHLEKRKEGRKAKRKSGRSKKRSATRARRRTSHR